MTKNSTAQSSTGFSVSIKFRNDSVLLYRNGYSKSADGKTGVSTQKFLCSFSTKCTDIPQKFDEYLHQATAGSPERYADLLERIKVRVLEPARKKAEQEKFKAQEERMKSWLSFALRQIESADSSVDQVIMANPYIQQMLKKLLREANGMVVKTAESAGQNKISDEQKVLELLHKINESYELLIEMMPFEKKHFSRDYKFTEETVNQVRKMWFNSSDSNRAMTVHEQLHRPKNWSELRAEVMGS